MYHWNKSNFVISLMYDVIPCIQMRGYISFGSFLFITKYNMALAPQFVGHRMGSVFAPHTLEVYLDYVVGVIIFSF